MATRIKLDLERRGHKVWYDVERLRAGTDWEAYIEEGLQECDKVLLLMTPHSVRRRDRRDPSSRDGFCLNELAKALELNKPIIPILVASLEHGPPVSISRIQYLDFRDVLPIAHHESQYARRFERLLLALEHDDLDFEGGQARLRRLLKPLDFDRELAQHVNRFTGRKWLLDELDAWVRDASASRVFWLVGPPGVGKTAFAAYLCHHYPNIAAAHFCVAGHQVKSDPGRAVLSIAYQLSQQLPEYEKRLSKLPLEEDVDKNAETLFETLLVQPFSTDFPAPDHDWLIVIDAVDEATHGDNNEIAQFLAKYWPQTPQWLRLVVTSKREAVSASPLRSLALRPRIIDADSPENQQDLRDYVIRELSAAKLFPSAEIVDALVERIGGIFLFARLLLNDIIAGHLSLKDIAAFPTGLSEYYRCFFARQFPDMQYYQGEIRPFLDVLGVAAGTTVSRSLIAGSGGLVARRTEVCDFVRTAAGRAGPNG